MFIPSLKIWRSYRFTSSSNAPVSPALAADTSAASSSRTIADAKGLGVPALTIRCAPGGCAEKKPVALIWQGTIVLLYISCRADPHLPMLWVTFSMQVFLVLL